MNTNFFVDQNIARRRTSLLIVMYIAAVLTIIFLTYWFFATLASSSPSRHNFHLSGFLHDHLFHYVFAILSTMIVLGSTYKIYSLASGGSAIAEMLGGTLIESNRGEAKFRRVLNIVEETAIAAGVPVPAVYVLSEEESINAFAAGYSTSDAVIAISQGCLDKLTRDELQGVIAHEFSHILNGDMRLNIRLIGVLHGILLLGLLGQFSMRSAAEVDDIRGSLSLLFIGFILFLLGYLGVFFGNLIKAAISRQREFLADASAVQFTRNPLGIGSALNKILRASDHKIHAARAAEASHFYFSSGLTEGFFGLLSTHPPLVERIKRIAPQFLNQTVSDSVSRQQVESEISALQNEGISGFSAAENNPLATSLNSALARSKQLISKISPSWREAAHQPASAQAVVLGVLLPTGPEELANAMELLHDVAPAQIVSELKVLCRKGIPLQPEEKFALVEIALPSMRSMSKEQFSQFRKVLELLINFDGKISLFEYTLGKTLRRHLEKYVKPQNFLKSDERSISSLMEKISILIEHVAFVGSNEQQQRCLSYRKGMQTLFPSFKSDPEFATRPSYAQLDLALEQIEKASPKLREQIMQAVIACVLADDHASSSELQIVRAIADHLECPIPLIEQ